MNLIIHLCLQKRGAKIYAELLGSSVRREGRSLSGAHQPTEIKHTMEDALVMSRLPPDHVDVVYAHGTGMFKGDEAEAEALRSLFHHNRKPILVSTKGALGHGFGFSGACDLVNAISSISTGEIPPTLNLDEPLPSLHGFTFLKKSERKKVDNVLVHTLGLGGGNSAVLFSKRFLKPEETRTLPA